ncbi:MULTISPECIES: sigma-70 family RNA polymerase sigma factor [unclassified Sphingomonas]|uniref:sigma-70 family RNA polymerase sigma factor n=1 Tax=unclassified Sphingomonas TaxID=196159 RepID=UPI000700D38A|nr:MULTISPECIES: sigma-70 family RNA polymerase sigma factor [unclassified Sphingomonas]KQX17556.1 RNA polymerase subunit sigma-24 [Sphingomonas sp. Root1294]KQY70482.1 RNA polymerase subunit sigma-24 [Sphingomonas sp. Root50]KRB92032.1 RNA polymerase subunit sigma-24 [Sphingomonas sp. Root720]
MTSAEELPDLLLAVADGDRAAFARFYGRTSAKLFGVVLRILPERSMAEDAMQEAYAKIWRNAAGFDARRGSPITWAATIARNVAIDLRRREHPAGRTRDDAFDFDALSDPHGASAEQLAALRICLDRLDADQRALILAAYLNGESREELAARLGHPTGTIKSWLHRGLARLKGCLDG